MLTAKPFKNTLVAQQRLRNEAGYLGAEIRHVSANNRWTKPRDWDNGFRWVSSPLASVVISAAPEVTTAPFATSTSSLITSLEIRAFYRLCGALFMVGEGARKEALDVIDEARRTYL